MRHGIAVTLAAGLLWLGSSNAAYAYLDPGTGSILLQLLLGGIAGVWTFSKLYWARIKAKFSFGKNATSNEHK